MSKRLYFADTLQVVDRDMIRDFHPHQVDDPNLPTGPDFHHDNTQQVTLTEGKCVQCGTKIYGSANSQCPKCGRVNNPAIPQVSRLPRIVQTVTTNIETRFEATAQMLEQTAQKLEARASDLYKKADWLRKQSELAGLVREAVAFEQTSFEEVQSLALVSVGMRTNTCEHGISLNT